MNKSTFIYFVKQREIIDSQIKEIKKKEKSKFKPPRLNEGKRFSINGMIFSKDNFLQTFKELIGNPPEHESLLKFWQNTDKVSLLNVNKYTFVIEY